MTFLNQVSHFFPSMGRVSFLVLSWVLVLSLFLAFPQAWAQVATVSNITGNSSPPTDAGTAVTSAATTSLASSALTTEGSAADNTPAGSSLNSANPVNLESPPILPSPNLTIQNAFAPLPEDAATRKTAPAANNKPRWHDLTVAQQKALAPLEQRWTDMPLVSKRKWLEISKNFGKLSFAEQEKWHLRMSEWVALSRKERTQARLAFVDSKSMDAQQKAAHWQAYQELSDEEKRKLAQASLIKPTGATTVKPQANNKLSENITTRHSAKTDEVKRFTPPLQNNTLLPKPTSAK